MEKYPINEGVEKLIEHLDKLSTTIKSIGLVFGSVFFKENGKLIKANLTDNEKSDGNLYELKKSINALALIDNQ